jgi:hypothetical protein
LPKSRAQSRDLSLILCGSRTCKPNSVRNTNAAGRSFLWATHYCGAQATYPKVVARRAGTPPWQSRSSAWKVPPYLVLLRVGFALPGALLRRRCALTAPFHPYLSLAAPAVCFLWHFPSNDPACKSAGALPDVIRHTALRSSDFPPVSQFQRATVRSGCQQDDYMRWASKVSAVKSQVAGSSAGSRDRAVKLIINKKAGREVLAL